MKTAKNMAIGMFMTVALVMSAILPTGCVSRKTKDIEEIQEVTEQFIETFATGNSKDLEDLVKGDFSFGFGEGRRDEAEIMLKIASKTQIEEYKSIEADRKEHKAKVRFKISYIDPYEFSKDLSGGMKSYMTKDGYLEAINSYEDRQSANMTFNFVFDEDEGQWVIKKTSADKYLGLFRNTWWLSIATISAADAKDAFNRFYHNLAQGEFDQENYTFDVDVVRVFDDGDYNDPIINEAAEEFARAYFGYIADNNPTVTVPDDYPYRAEIRGYAPSREEILDYFSSDEFLIEQYMTIIRAESVDNAYSDSEVWSHYYAGIYYDLAKRIPFMDREEYYNMLYINPKDSTVEISHETEFFTITTSDVYAASLTTQEQKTSCFKKAVEALYYAGELSEAQYVAYMAQIGTDDSSKNPDSSFVNTIDISDFGDYEDQAVNTYEYTPDWSDGTLIYGASDVDGNSVCMHYSKEPGWLNTAGYCINDDGITVMLLFDKFFRKDTVLICDWYINGDKYGGSIDYTVEEEGKPYFAFTLPGVEIPKYGSVELRLWEEDHSHVIAYVKLTKT